MRLSSIGDVVCAMPAAMALRRRFPRARLAWAVEPDAAPLLQGHASGVTPVLVPRHGGPLVRARAVRDLRDVRPDLVVDVQGNAKSGTVARLAARGAPILGLAREDVREWSNLAFTTVKAPPTGERHTVLRNLALLRPLGVEPGGPLEYGLRVMESERAAAAARLGAAGLDPARPVVLLHAGNPRDVRQWPHASYAALARQILRSGRQVAVEGSEAGPEFREAFDAGAADLTRGVGLRDLAALLAELAAVPGSLLVSADTSVPHLAAAAGLPVVLLAGPQDPGRTGPPVAGTRVLDAWEGLPCAPCLKRRCHYEEDRACMRRIAPEAVARVIEAP